jgi:tetratricopeptide (TPR) repeat protein
VTRLGAVVAIAAVLGAGACATSPVTPRDAFPLDPREQLPGPFPSAVERGFGYLVAGDASKAAAEFSSARSGGGRAAEIGWIEARVLSGGVADANRACADAMAAPDATLPLLVACGEAAAADGRPRDGYRLYQRALARGGASRPGLSVRSEELRRTAADGLVGEARQAAQEGRIEEGREAAKAAMELDPGSAAALAAAAALEATADDRQLALDLYRQAVELEPTNATIGEEAASFALENADEAFAVTVFDRLAKEDSIYEARAEEARLAFRVANWPEQERQAARAPKLSRAAAATLVWWMVPEVREAVVTSGVIASDAVSRRDSRAVTRAVALGLLETDRETHRASPDAPLSIGAASRLLGRLLLLLEPPSERIPCAANVARPPRTGAETAQIARDCGLIEGRDSGPMRGPDFVSALDRLRALASPPAEN